MLTNLESSSLLYGRTGAGEGWAQAHRYTICPDRESNVPPMSCGSF